MPAISSPRDRPHLGPGPDGADLAAASDASLYGSAAKSLYVIDATTGAAALVGGIGFRPDALALRPSIGYDVCLDKGFEPRSGLSRFVLEITGPVEHLESCEALPDGGCGRCGAAGFCRIHPQGGIRLERPAGPDGLFRMRFLVRAPRQAGPVRLRVGGGKASLDIEAADAEWRWTKPIAVPLYQDVESIILLTEGGEPLDIETIEVDAMSCAG